MSCGTTILEIDGLRVTLAGPCCGNRPMVDDVCLTVRRGEVTGLIGESGCGKSLTCLAVMDLLPPAMQRSDGSIRLVGELPEKSSQVLPACFRGRRAAMVLQNPMSCFDADLHCRPPCPRDTFGPRDESACMPGAGTDDACRPRFRKARRDPRRLSLSSSPAACCSGSWSASPCCSRPNC